MSVQNAMASAIYTKLNAATAVTSRLAGTTAIYHQQAPDHASYPYIVYQQMAGGPENLNPSDLRSMLWQVAAYGTLTAGQVGSVDAQVSSLLHQGSLAVSGYSNIWTARVTDLSAVYNQPDGVRMYLSGGIYRVRLDA